MYAVLLGGLFLLAPPSAYFQALSVGEASFLEQIAYHSGPPPVPLVSALATRFHEHGLHAFDHLNDGQESRASDGQLLRCQLFARAAAIFPAISLPARFAQGNCDSAALDIS